MPVYLDLANLIFSKKIINKKYLDGIEQFRSDYDFVNHDRNQEDEELFLIAKMNLDEFDLNSLTVNGLHYDNENQISSDFVATSQYGGAIWKADWLDDNGVFAWHIKCEKSQINRANEISELTMGRIQELYEEGVDILSVIKVDINMG